MTVEEYVAQPWTVHGRAMRDTPNGALYYLLTVEEMPGFSIVAATLGDAMGMLGTELREYVQAMLDSGRTVPVPAPPNASR